MKRAALIALVLAVGSAVVVARDLFDGEQERARERPSERSMPGAADSFMGNVDYDGRIVFVRIRFDTGFGPGMFRAGGSRGEPPWAHDYPTADTHLMKIFEELTMAAPRTDGSNVFKFDDPELFDFPVAYVSEPGYLTLSESEARGLREYLHKGGFVIFDDFRQNDWYNLEEQMKKALPEARWVTLDQTARVFNSFFEIRNFSFGAYGQETYFGIFEDNDPTKRLMAVAGHNQDLGEFWEFSDTGRMPVDLSNEAYKFGVNYFIYGLIH